MNKISSHVLHTITDTAGVLHGYCVCFRKTNMSYLSQIILKKGNYQHNFYGYERFVSRRTLKAQGQKLSFHI